MKALRSHTCGELNAQAIGQDVRLMGFAHAVRNLGGLLFIDLRDHHGITQVIIHPEQSFFAAASDLRSESVIAIEGKVRRRESVNNKIPTGEIEVICSHFELESPSDILPFPVAHNPKEESEDTRLKYRFLDLRTEKMHRNIIFRSQFIHYLRNKMVDLGFLEFQTPILTSSSPEGARDFLVPSRLHPGHFYALPQAPQQFKQLLMCSGFDRYFQIAPCFRDEDARADRSPGEFYQLDVEMAFATQEEIFTVIEKLMVDLFTRFSDRPILENPFPRIPYRTALEKYGSDKPDLRFGLEMVDVSTIFASSNFEVFQKTLQAKRGVLRAIHLPQGAAQSRKFFDDAQAQARAFGLGGLPYLSLKDGEWKGSLQKQTTDTERAALSQAMNLENGDAVAFIVGEDSRTVLGLGGKMRSWLAETLKVEKKHGWAFCWIVDFPFYEWNEDEQKIDFCHNPFSMPQGGLDALNGQDPLDILAYQYDIVCNGVELSSGAIRNHRRDIMKRAFELAGYTEDDIQTRFPALWNAFSYGPPPHGGIAPGVDRMIMLLLDEPNIRQVIAFPLNQKGQDLLMNAPSSVKEKQLQDVHISLRGTSK
ncbi:MAG: aspartate--tRNA ligase [Betaproteobacteria bacterium]|nr:aspartate--tRNA ligase [Betaproteobacteria bacterium]